jgi:trigger factor
MAKELTGAAEGEKKFAVSVEAPSECKRLLSIEIPAGELEREKELVLAELRRDLKVPGFRKGKVPVKYIEKNYEEVIHNDAVRNLLPHIYEEALVREGIVPIGEPRFENVKAKGGEPITFDVAVEVRPNPEIKGYQGLKIKVEIKKIEDAKVDETLDHLRERMTTLKVVDRDVREGDIVVIDYGPLLESGEIDKKSFAQNYPVDLAGESLLKGFREGLVGMWTRDEKEVTVDYPDDFPEKDMAGTSKRFRVTVKEIKEREMPELNDDFAKRVGQGFETLEDMKRKIREDLIEDEDKRSRHEAEEKIIDKIIENNQFEVPDAMVNNYLTSILEEDRQRRPDVDEEVREKEIREHFRKSAVRTIRKYFILEAISKQESIEVDDAEVDARIEEMAQGGEERSEEVKAYFANPSRRRSLTNDLHDQKVLAFLRENADIKAA